ncbi:MAG: hypothetical protein KF713_17125 [Turneriella sp.]|nr:hypothetical protein [Turneriella sp.]
MKPRHLIIAIPAVLAVLYFLTRDAEKKSGIVQRQERITVISASYNAADYQPDLDNYRLERDELMAKANYTEARIKPEFKSGIEYKQSNLRAKIPAGPVDDFGAPFFIPTETAMTDPKVFEQELAKHKERSDAYVAARMDEMRMNTTAEKAAISANIQQAKAAGTKSPEEIKRAEDALARIEVLEKVLKGEKVEKILD